jgi:hypothetical protein
MNVRRNQQRELGTGVRRSEHAKDRIQGFWKQWLLLGRTRRVAFLRGRYQTGQPGSLYEERVSPYSSSGPPGDLGCLSCRSRNGPGLLQAGKVFDAIAG